MGNKFKEEVKTTVGFGAYSKTFQLTDGSVVNCFILDTAGQEVFKSLTVTYYRQADAILLLYDITKKNTFDEIKNYYSKEIRERCKKNIPVILIGNKLDKESEREVSRKEAIELSKSEKYKFKETSCKTNENVDDAFKTLIELWNIEYKKKKLVGERSNSDEFRKGKKREPGRDEMVTYYASYTLNSKGYNLECAAYPKKKKKCC